ncbi:hypothetical protein ANCDUO_04610 [Ancylostoma duodenale]|uniref:Homogentisate 1,2-dioxygenase N-terminal domain-containing protein n=1 Tax=Ancylostoma duodenale TaxID=51022 RepID=A0A0C2H0L1_9BILA|nr:hypothetical protein ANCDUO_04610 [Ancylostoma duodenale]
MLHCQYVDPRPSNASRPRANGLANPRDFKTPVAWFEDVDMPFKIYNKYQGSFFVSEQVQQFPVHSLSF